jgi:quercetin dioxygenase-like cupin family protein
MVIAVEPEPAAYVLDGSSSRSVRCAGGHARILAAPEHTGGALGVVEGLLPVGTRLPSHTHAAADLSIYVLQGELEIDSRGTRWSLGAGGFALLPRDVPHAVRSIGPWAARVVWTVWPAAAQPDRDVEDLSDVLARYGACFTRSS